MSKKTGFTLVELLVAMAIIGVLIALAIYGVSAAQRAQRDTSRKSAASDISVGIQDYYDRNGNYPNTVAYNNNYLYLYRTGTTCAAQSDVGNLCISVPLKGNTAPSATVSGTSFASAIVYVGDDTDASKSRYCLKIETDGYTLGAKLETGSWVQVGSTQKPSTCT